MSHHYNLRNTTTDKGPAQGAFSSLDTFVRNDEAAGLGLEPAAVTPADTDGAAVASVGDKNVLEQIGDFMGKMFSTPKDENGKDKLGESLPPFASGGGATAVRSGTIGDVD